MTGQKPSKGEKKLAKRVHEWELIGGDGGFRGGKTKIVHGTAYHRPGSQNVKQHR